MKSQVYEGKCVLTTDRGDSDEVGKYHIFGRPCVAAMYWNKVLASHFQFGLPLWPALCFLEAKVGLCLCGSLIKRVIEDLLLFTTLNGAPDPRQLNPYTTAIKNQFVSFSLFI